MVEPFTLGVVVAALLAKALDRAEDDVVEAGDGAVRRLLRLVRERFGGDREAGANTALMRVEDAPDSPARIQELGRAIDGVAERDAEFRSAIETLIREARESGVDVAAIVQTATGSQITQVADVTDSTVHVSYATSPRDRPPGL